MRVLALVVVLLATCVLADNVPNSGLKNETAPGKYHDRYNNHRHRERHHYRPPLIDQFVCDLDATILVVASTPAKEEEKPSSSYGQPSGGNSYGAPPSGYGSSQNYQSGGNSYGAPPSSGYQQAGGYNGGQGSSSYGGNDNSYGSQSGGYGEKKEGSYVQKSVPNAVRLKCSHIAIRSEHDCNSCCELAARRDHSVSRKDIFGFIVDASELVNSESGLTRYKRSAPPAPAPYSSNAPPAAPASYSGSAPPSPAPPAPYSGNAPPSAPPAPYSGNAPSYQAPAPQPGYQQPPAAPPSSGYQGESPAPPPPSSNYEQGGDYSGGSSQSSYSNGGYSTDVYTGPLQYPIPPKNARCVCCAPKGYEHRHREHRRRHHDRRRYDSEESDEYY